MFGFVVELGVTQPASDSQQAARVQEGRQLVQTAAGRQSFPLLQSSDFGAELLGLHVEQPNMLGVTQLLSGQWSRSSIRGRLGAAVVDETARPCCHA